MPHLVVTDLGKYALDKFTRVFEGSEDLLGVTQPVGMDLQHGVEVLHVGQMLLHLSLNNRNTV